ncbi:MAG: flagellar M-ring protein FliF, partial [Hyphomonadaceae bacterium]|nr:flagellar M-ring protein FliF [Hyphomonadaceae bacterium]
MNQLLQNVMKASPLRLAIGFAIAAVAAALLFGLISFSGREQKALLFADLDLTEAGRIGERLDQAKVPYEVRGDGSSIFVPRSRVAEVRLMLAADGLPSRGSVGYELFDQSDPLGQTQFQQDINRLRALEGELARTIVALDAVSSARVHLVLPERRLFEQDKEQPSASILLKLIGGTISAEQVQAIRNLAAGAVPGLLPGKVTILDDRGELLAAEDPEGTAGAAAVADERKQAYETRIRATVLDIVEGVV